MMNNSAIGVLNERIRQGDSASIGGEGFTDRRDDEYKNDELIRAAICYLRASMTFPPHHPSLDWPFAKEWFKPTDSRRDAEKAGALILAEIDRQDRAAGNTSNTVMRTPLQLMAKINNINDHYFTAVQLLADMWDEDGDHDTNEAIESEVATFCAGNPYRYEIAATREVDTDGQSFTMQSLILSEET